MKPSTTLPLTTDKIARQYGPMVSSLCSRMLRNPQDAAEAAQESWLNIIQALPSYRSEAKLSTWIYTITKRIILKNAVKERQYSIRFLREYFHAEKPITDIPDTEQIRNEWIREQCDNCLVGTLHCLDNNARLAYLLRDVAELSYGDISQIMALDEPHVRQIISRSRRKLRHFLADECILFNPDGACRCRMRKHVKEIKLAEEYQKIRKFAHHINIFKESEQILPRKNYWEKFLR